MGILAVFVECAISKAKADKDITLWEEQRKQRDTAHELMDVFSQIGGKKSPDRITYDEWLAFLRTGAGKDFLILFDVDLKNSRELFSLLDSDDSGDVDLKEFVVTFVQMNGSATGAKQHEAELDMINQRRLLRRALETIEKDQVQNRAMRQQILAVLRGFRASLQPALEQMLRQKSGEL